MINENDTTTTDEISFGNNDFLAAQVAILLGAERLLLLTDAEGVYTADPRSHPDAQLVSEVTEFDGARWPRHRPHTVVARLRWDAIEDRRGGDGDRGRDPDGDRGRADPGVNHRGGRRRAPIGTRFAAREGRYSSFKLWLKYAKPVRGRVLVDAGAARALREGGTSLLPVGVVEVSGDFDAGDAVEVAHDGESVGKGICNYSATELRRVRGMKSADVRELLPRASEEAVHRDYFVLA